MRNSLLSLLMVQTLKATMRIRPLHLGSNGSQIGLQVIPSICLMTAWRTCHSEHVGKIGNELLAIVRGDNVDIGLVSIIRERDGSFPSVEAAAKLVNSTLAQNSAIVDLVASGRRSQAFVTAQFDSKTGIEAYRPT